MSFIFTLQDFRTGTCFLFYQNTSVTSSVSCYLQCQPFPSTGPSCMYRCIWLCALAERYVPKPWCSWDGCFNGGYLDDHFNWSDLYLPTKYHFDCPVSSCLDSKFHDISPLDGSWKTSGFGGSKTSETCFFNGKSPRQKLNIKTSKISEVNTGGWLSCNRDDMAGASRFSATNNAKISA